MILKISMIRYFLLICYFGLQQNTAIAKNSITPLTTTKIGVLAYHGDQRTADRWQPTINYLNTQFKELKFELVTLQLHEVDVAIRTNQLDFIITNTGNYIKLEHQFGISRMATLINKQLQQSTTVFGAVIFTRVDRDDINSISDLKNKSLIAVNENGFGGFQIAWGEFKKNNFNPYEDFNEIKFTGFPQSQVIQAVLNKEFDVGTFRSDSLEQLVDLGAIDLSTIKIINQQHTQNFPFIHSSTLYPEWPFSKLKQTSTALAHRVALALLSIENNSSAATAANSAGWTIPLNYKPANDLMKFLQVGPYKNLSEINFKKIFFSYWHVICLVSVLFIVVFVFAYIFKKLNTKLIKTNEILKTKIQESSRLTTQLKHQATHDPLTNVYNRYAFNDFMDKELQRCKRNKTKLAVIIIDLDNFKQINDNYGHHAGDEFLIQFCSRINTELRDSDINARLGGDEFAILCLDINGEADLKLLTDRILTIAKTAYYLDSIDQTITETSFSLGVAIYPLHGTSAELLLRHSDFEMYKMKKTKPKHSDLKSGLI
jgi:diguanylate cyclase (GGDEF)-like protein